MTYDVFGGTLSLTQSINQSFVYVARRSIVIAYFSRFVLRVE